jgi:hypothetical protein
MPQLINHFSYAIAGALALIAFGWWAARRRTVAALALFLASAALIVGADLALRPGQAALASTADFDRQIAGGKPVLVEFYSNY